MREWARSTFKTIYGLTKKTENSIIDMLMGIDLEESAKNKIERVQERFSY